MAIAKTIQIHNSKGIENVNKYIDDPEKTKLTQAQIARELEYGTNTDKTTMSGSTKVLVSGYKCSPTNAASDFYFAQHKYETTHTEARYQTKQPVIAIHLIQSFPADKDLDPQLVHQIGMELVQSLKDHGLGDFQAVVSTHMNTQHLHNHILLNAFSVDGTRKYYANWETLSIVRQINDELSLKYGLPILQTEEQSQDHSEKIGERYARDNGVSWKEQMKQDIISCAQSASTYAEWYAQMRAIGYTFRNLSDGTPISISDGEHSTRLSRLGREYTYDGIVEQIAAQRGIDVEAMSRELEEQRLRASRVVYTDLFKKVSRYDDYGRRRSDLEIVLLTMIRYFKRLLERLKQRAAEAITLELQQQIDETTNRISTLEKVLELMQTYKLDRISDISAEKKKVGHDHRNAKNSAEELAKNIRAINDAIANGSVGKKLSEISPMTATQRRDLFTVAHESGWYLNRKFEDISAGEAAETNDFLKAVREHPDDKNLQPPAVLTSSWKYGKDLESATIATPEVLQNELQIVIYEQAQYTGKEEQLAKQYKDLVFLDMTCHDAMADYDRFRKKLKDDKRKRDEEQDRAQHTLQNKKIER